MRTVGLPGREPEPGNSGEVAVNVRDRVPSHPPPSSKVPNTPTVSTRQSTIFELTGVGCGWLAVTKPCGDMILPFGYPEAPLDGLLNQETEPPMDLV